MKRLVTTLLAILTIASASGQKPPTLQHKLATDGALTLTWPVQILTNTSTNLNASYQLELANEVGAWAPLGALLRGEKFPNHLASIRLTNLLDPAASFFRVRAVFDFTGGNFVGKTIQGKLLPNSIFFGANFFDAALDGTSFDNADLAAADFRFATMTQITATNADFTLARLADTDLTSANLASAKLLLADFSGAKLTFTDLSGADLRGAIIQPDDSNFTHFHNTIVDPTTVFDRRCLAIWLIVNGQATNRTFSDVDLSFSDLSGGNLQNANLAGIDLSGADFTNADLRGANLTNAILRTLDLRGTKMDDTTNITNRWRTIWDIINDPKPDRSHPNTDLSLGFWIGATLERADVHNSNFTRGIMDDVNFEGANASAARFTSVEFRGANFKNANLQNATFSNAFLDNVTFLGANTTNVNFIGATFINTTMSDGSIRN
ncbi:MAG TPA: pentapeptide repeat-containing protein [Verrucomicrobiae bacterium]